MAWSPQYPQPGGAAQNAEQGMIKSVLKEEGMKTGLASHEKEEDMKTSLGHTECQTTHASV